MPTYNLGADLCAPYLPTTPRTVYMSSAPVKSDADWSLLFVAWLLATAAMLGSLFFSEVMALPPCKLCWYQRICLFPLPLVLGAGLLASDRQVVRYALPLTAVGWLIACWHNLLYFGVIPESAAPCSQGVSCTQDDLGLFEFITIPMLSMAGFTMLLALLLMIWKRSSR